RKDDKNERQLHDNITNSIKYIYLHLSASIYGSFNPIRILNIAIIAIECFEPETSFVSSLPCFYTKRPRSPGQR
ncbi:MAG: hypothetical protein IKW70_06205, partial [Verrucomicrobia bacterium]|nr:hypothetical protein [Verrucomicrobiota bacterium]